METVSFLDENMNIQMKVKILDSKTREQLCYLDKVEPHSTVGDIKSLFHRSYPQWYPARQALKIDLKDKTLRDDEILQNLPVGTSASFYFRDLGPQLGWTMVFLSECAGALLTYLLFYFRMPFIYSHRYVSTSKPHYVVILACICHSSHYVKKLMETIFVHRFSAGTLPLRTIIRNCAYYWGFSAWSAYYINHPLYTPPSLGDQQVNCALVMFLICEVGNFSIHLTLNGLRGEGATEAQKGQTCDPTEQIFILFYGCEFGALLWFNTTSEGSRGKRFPVPTKNPFTWLFHFVSCPNYTYEIGAWMSFSIMTQCLPVAFYAVLSFVQMSIWAKGKHRAYSREFRDYPANRTAIIPLIL